KVGTPAALAPDVWYGASDDFTIGVVHSKFATTGFRGSAGNALCVTTGCASLYNNVGVEGWGAVLRGRFALVVGGGLDAVAIDKGYYAGKLGFKARVAFGRVSLATTPSVLIALNERDSKPPSLDQLYVP